MLPHAAPAGSATRPDSRDSPSTRLLGTPLLTARAIWLAVTLLSLALFGVSVPAQLRYQGLGGTQVFFRRNAAGEILIWPTAGGPADRAGVRPGDVVVAIDGQQMGPEVHPSTLGASGTPVALAVRTGDGPQREYTITRVHQYGGSLAQLGLSVNFYAGYHVGLDILTMLGMLLVALLIIWHRSDDWLALFVALMLVVMGVRYTGDFAALRAMPGPWTLPSDVVYCLGWVLSGLFFYLFPNGRFVPRWTRMIAVYAVVWPVGFIFFPPALNPQAWLPRWLTDLLNLIIYGTGVYAQIYRYRHISGPVERQQTKWVVFGAAVAVVGYFGYAIPLLNLPVLSQDNLPALYFELIGYSMMGLAGLMFALALGLAILRHRLWEIDIVLNRTLVYGALTASVAGLYVLLVVALGALFQARGSLPISLLATGGVAVLFQPLRDRLQRGVNHLLYGEREEPYIVLTRLGERLEATLAPEAVLPAVAQTVAEALKLPYVAITLATTDDAAPIQPAEDGLTVVAAAGTPVAEVLRLPLVYQHERLGELRLAPRAPGEPFTPADRRLLADLARQAGVAVYAVRLTSDLQRARERLVLAREEERRRLRRDLHDGLGPTLAAQTLKVGSARALLTRNPGAADALLEGLEADIAAALTDIRRLVYNLRPPALDELGLLGAIRQHAARYQGSGASGLQIVLDAPEDLPPLPAAVEVATYRIMQEALTNVVRHAHAHTCQIHLMLNGGLSLEIRDDGVGLPQTHHAGVGLVSMRERAAELGGTCVIELAPGGGTRVRTRLPLP